jgi:hypothetical protein
MDAQYSPSSSARKSAAPAIVAIQPLLLKPQRMNGLTERLMVSHYENNYGGALRRLNAIRARLAALDWASTPVFEINGLKREELIAAGSVIPSELRRRGYDARALVGGITAWHAIGGATVPLDTATYEKAP